MGNLVISNSVLEQANISPSELRLEVAIYLYAQKRLNINQAHILAGQKMDSFITELKKRGISINSVTFSNPLPSESTEKPHFLADLAGTLAGPDGDELAEIVAREFQQIEGEW